MKKKTLLLSLGVLAIIFTGCNDNKSTTTETTTTQNQSTKNLENKITTQEETTVQIEKKEEPKIVKSPMIPSTNDIQKQIVTTSNNTTSSVKKIASKIDAKILYKKCAGCHGINAEKSALGKSKIIRGWDSEKIANALNGYKTGTYGGPMKALMKSQVSTLSKKEIKELSTYIAAF